MLQELKFLFEELYPQFQIVTKETKETIIVEVQSYSTNIPLNFAKISKISEFIGTTDFDIENNFIKGHQYSEVTCDADELLLIFKFDKNKIKSL